MAAICCSYVGSPNHGQGNVLISKCLKSGFGNDVFTRSQHASGKATQQKCQGAFFRLTIRKCDCYHLRTDSNSLLSRKQGFMDAPALESLWKKR